ncbi:MAG: hypothetical protein K2P26_00955 [Oscillospiraceae bacterium]|nr:hypothetical protein [Oscillospiraceae bacterium]
MDARPSAAGDADCGEKVKNGPAGWQIRFSDLQKCVTFLSERESSDFPREKVLKKGGMIW